MKKTMKILALVLVAVMMMALSTAAFAQTEGTAAEGTGSITISNAAKSETYSVYKLFDATVSATTTEEGESTSVAYTGTIPESLSAYFVADDSGNITATDAAKGSDGKLSSEAVEALTAWAKTQQATASAESDGSELTFAGLAYGYYVVVSTQGAAISVDSTKPDVTIIDKNTTPPINNPTKSADDDDVFIGQTVTYTIEFETANYDGTKQIVSYTITDTPAANSLTDIKVTSIKVGDTEIDVQQFDKNNTIVIPWAEATTTGEGEEAETTYGASLYPNGAKLVITYTAVVADTAAIDGAGNTNKVDLSYTTDDGNSTPYEETIEETIYTYAVAIQKVDQSGEPLEGATFQLPFYVKKTPAADGAYVYAFATPPTEYADDDSAENYTNSLTTPANGLIIIKGVAQGTYSFTETDAPDGYNKLTAPVEVAATKTSKTSTSTTTYFDADGNKVDEKTEDGFEVLVKIDDLAATPVVVVNKTGSELPSTGGIGTTIFYVVGSLLVVSAGVVLVTKKRMGKDA